MDNSIVAEPGVSVTLIPLVWAAWLVLLIIFIVFTAIFYYHWIKYDWEDKKIKRSSWLFLIGGIFLLLTSASAVFLL